jgi:hypothetical protein
MSDAGLAVSENKQRAKGESARADRQFNIGAIFSSPRVANGDVHFGSTDSFIYALE